MFDIPDELVTEYADVAVCLLPEYCKKSKHFVIAYADNGNNFLDYGIVEGSVLYFDQELECQENFPCLYYSKEKNELRLLRNSKDGYEFVGRLIAVVHHFPV